MSDETAINPPEPDRPPWFNNAIAVLLGVGGLVFVLLLVGAGSSLITDEAPDAGSTLYESGPGAGGADASTPAGAAEFVITGVSFEGDGFVEITNVGTATGGFSGWFLCQRPSYGSFDVLELSAGASVQIPPGDGGYGSLSAANGEIGLYRDSSFGSAASIVSYVEWGSTGHGRSGTAVEGGVWDGGFVDSGGASRITAPGGATSAAGWTSG